MKILIVDDEKNVVELIKFNLELNNYETESVFDGLDALELIFTNEYDLVVLDNMLPGMNGLEIIKQTRANSKTRLLPILMLTANSDESDIVKGLNLGADDYITKPFSVQELIARVNSIVRRSKITTNQSIIHEFESFTLYENEHKVVVNDERVDLTKKEFKLLLYLIKNKNVTVSREELLAKIWDHKNKESSRTVDVHIRSLRSKIEKDTKNPKYLKTKIGEGYQFNE